MFVPQLRERVRVQGSDEVFVVLYVNGARTWADLVCIERVGFLTQVPLESISPVGEDTAPASSV